MERMSPIQEEYNRLDRENRLRNELEEPSVPRSSRKVTTPGMSRASDYYAATKTYANLSTTAKELDNHIYSMMVMTEHQRS